MKNNYKKKLIEVAIPLEAINAASAREKSIRHGHPSTLHLWWARRPLAACRAVLFCQLVDDPSEYADELLADEKTCKAAESELKSREKKREQDKEDGKAIPIDEKPLILDDIAIELERKRLFTIIEELVKWENSTNEEVLERARAEIKRSCGGVLPPVYDPFSGGGSIPLEAQRLGLPAYGSDLNPVAVMIGKAMIEIPPKFKDMEPIHPGIKERNHYRNAEGLAEDVKYYGEWMREKAWERIGHLYPQVDLPSEYGGGKATVIAWIWARTVPSPDPAFSDVQVPLASTFLLSSRDGDEAWIEPEIDRSEKKISFHIRRGGTKAELEAAAKGSKMSRGANFRCLISDAAISPEYVKKAAKKGDLGKTLIAVIANLPRGKAYLAPNEEQINADESAIVKMAPSLMLPKHPQYNGVSGYGMENFGEIFTDRQLVSLETLCDMVGAAADQVESDFNDEIQNGRRAPTKDSAQEYGRAISTYLAFAIDKVADRNSSLVNWAHNRQHASNTFKRQALPMTWDFSEINPFSNSSGNFEGGVRSIYLALEELFFPASGQIEQLDAQSGNYSGKVISTDPPYYDNVPYADISDFFYIWMKRSLASFYPELFDTVAVPKGEELVADRVRHHGKQKADDFFLNGMSAAFSKARNEAADIAPMAIYYAFKQSEISQDGVSSAGWVSFLEAVLMSGFSIVGTWPVRTELARRVRGLGSNALANSVVLVCRKKEDTAKTITRAEFIRALKKELPPAIAELQAANVSPADMPQSAIGPGMGVFSRYKTVLEADDSPMTVKTALQLINAELDEFLNDLHGEFDADTRFAATWFEQHGTDKGDYGAADNLARARGISVESVKHAGIVKSEAGKVRILKRDELLVDWDPNTDPHLTVWECCQYLIRALENEGEHAAAMLLKKMGADKAEAVKDLAYCLYDICSNKRKDAKEATSYNALIAVWTELTRQAASISDYELAGDGQTTMNI